MEKMNPAQKMNNKVDGTPKAESKKVAETHPGKSGRPPWAHTLPMFAPVEVQLLHHHQ